MFKDHLAHLKYTLMHKWYVFFACIKMKVPLYRAFIHDLSKFTKTEWTPYVKHFFNKNGSRKDVRDKTGAYDPNSQGDDFTKAWINHQKNKHHYQSWCSIGDNGIIYPVEIPETHVREMIADWIGAAKAQGFSWTPQLTRDWYMKNGPKMKLHELTKKKIEKILSEL